MYPGGFPDVGTVPNVTWCIVKTVGKHITRLNVGVDVGTRCDQQFRHVRVTIPGA